MHNRSYVPVIEDDPKHILGVADNASDKDIRIAYLKKIKQYPPDRSPEAFERIRDAYSLLSDPRSRARFLLQSADPEAPLVKLLDGQKSARRFIGPDPWLAAMKKR